MAEHKVALDSLVVHPVLRGIYRSEGVFDRPQSKLPLQAPPSCSRVAHWPELSGRTFELGMLDLLPAATTPLLAGKAATAELFGVMKKGTSQRRVL